MFTQSTRQVIRDVLDLFAKASGIPLEFYEFDDKGRITNIIRTDSALFPPFCHMVWALEEGRGEEECRRSMRTRAEQTWRAGKSQVLTCHAGLANRTDPIMLNGKIVAVIQYGAYLPDSEEESRRVQRAALARDAASRLHAPTDKTARLVELQTSTVPRHPEEKWELLRAILPQHLANIIGTSVTQAERERRIERNAYHDLQLRLVAAVARAKNLRDTLPRSQPIRRSVEDIAGAIDASITVVHNLTQGQYLPDEYRFKPTRISRFIDEALPLCLPTAEKKGLQFDMTELDAEFEVDASAMHLQQAFNNLLQNAVKYSYRTTAESRQRYIVLQGDKRWRGYREGYEFSVQNYGVGVEPDELTLVFEEGYKGRLVLREYRTGSGQGLALTKRVVEAHGGSIRVTSERVGEGPSPPYLTRFAVWLPMRQEVKVLVPSEAAHA